MIYLLDTNIISFLLKGNTSIKANVAKKISEGCNVQIPVVAYYEAKRGLIAAGATTKLQSFINFVNKLGILNTTISTYDIAAQIYADLSKNGNIIEDADIFLGASAIEHDAILVTNNEKHLSHIKNLKLEVWN